MLKKTIIISTLLFSSQSILALDLGGITGAASEAKETADNANTANKAADTLKNNSIADTAKKAAVEGGKGGAKGAVEGVKSGSITKDASKGAIDGAKSAFK